MKISLIESEEQYDEALKRIYNLIQQGTTLGSEEPDELEQLSGLVEEYEKANYPMPKPQKC